MRMTQRQYNALPHCYRGTVDGKPYALYLDGNAGTVYGPVEIMDEGQSVAGGADNRPKIIGGDKQNGRTEQRTPEG